MDVKYKPSYDRDIDKITNKDIAKRLEELIKKLKEVDNLFNVSNCKKIKKNENRYRIRIGNYRLGIEKKEDTIFLVRFLHKKDFEKDKDFS